MDGPDPRPLLQDRARLRAPHRRNAAAHQAGLDKPQYRLSEIFLYAPDQASRVNAKARAEDADPELNQGADFQTLAQQFSAAPSAAAGGDLTGSRRATCAREIEDAVLKAPSRR